ncbi:hypothetical protein MBLNU459_g1035t1 [Dothideomycetes sp. NU459]
MPTHFPPSHTAAPLPSPDRFARSKLPTTASSTTSSPSRRSCSHFATSKMPSPRASPAMRPSSPLSPRFDSGPRYESLQPSSPRGLHPRSAAAAAASSQRRHNTASLKLPSLPRFHPANFPSQHSSLTNTPATGPNSPQPPTSPMAQQKLYSEAQKQLYLYQRETIAAAGRSSARERPVSPRLDPLGSPGPVTPFELEGQEGYLHAGAHGAGHHDARSKELVEKLVEEEVRRNASMAQQSHQSPSSFPVL